MDFENFRSEFSEKSPLFRNLEEETLFILKGELEKKKVKIHSLISRVKTLESFLEKTERKNFNNPLTQVGDIVGLRVVCLFLSDIKKIGTILKDSFEIIEEDNKIEGFELDSLVICLIILLPNYRVIWQDPVTIISRICILRSR